ncbi:hypothetical protein MHSWG343_08590 [Candidatus Mycoplasma haematohominis]|uniref:Uncharacterized protein n=1 Tax=Candidatus Mycoplasma haematohominis TaxID=1494318 RepID=A0A478FR17_9MOLU|nr:hypothetical protein MHSWG343_08590 [Candidatus Mycoplasma haemohominis]
MSFVQPAAAAITAITIPTGIGIYYSQNYDACKAWAMTRECLSKLRHTKNTFSKTIVADLYWEHLITTSGYSSSDFPAQSAWKVKYRYLQDNYLTKYSHNLRLKSVKESHDFVYLAMWCKKAYLADISKSTKSTHYWRGVKKLNAFGSSNKVSESDWKQYWSDVWDLCSIYDPEVEGHKVPVNWGMSR